MTGDVTAASDGCVLACVAGGRHRKGSQSERERGLAWLLGIGIALQSDQIRSERGRGVALVTA